MIRHGRDLRPRSVPLRRIVPNLLTTISLTSGLVSIHFSLDQDWDKALAGIAVAAIFDALDGATARLLRSTSRFGAVLDSLSDFLSFGVAPAVVLHQWMLGASRWIGLAATITFVLCAALRLARFTSQRRGPTGSPLTRFFIGLPTPAAAAIVLIPVMIATSRTLENYRLPEWIVITHAFFIAWLMISRRPCFSFKRLRIPRRQVVPLLLAVGLAVMIAARDAWLAATLAAATYLCSIPFSVVMYARLKRSAMVPSPRADLMPAERPEPVGAPIHSRG